MARKEGRVKWVSLNDVEVVDYLESRTRLRAWIHAICLVEFLAEEGHRMTCLYPPQALSSDAIQRVSKLALPVGEKALRDRQDVEEGPVNIDFIFKLGSAAGISRVRSFSKEDSELFGFCRFARSVLSDNTRNCWQRSVVILTPTFNYHLNRSLTRTLIDLIPNQAGPLTAAKVFARLCLLFATQLPPQPSSTSTGHYYYSPRVLDLRFEGTLIHSVLPPQNEIIAGHPFETNSHELTPVTHSEHLSFFSAESDDSREESDEIVPSHEEIPHLLNSQAEHLGLSAKLSTMTSACEKLFNSEVLADPRFNSHFPELSIGKALANSIPCLLAFWELLITATPILVFGLNSTQVSETVLILGCLIAPLKFVGIQRPLVDVYDPDFFIFASASRFKSRFGKCHSDLSLKQHRLPSNGKRQGLNFGTTNPLCLNSMSAHCPAIYAINVPVSSIYVPKRVKKARHMRLNQAHGATSAFRGGEFRSSSISALPLGTTQPMNAIFSRIMTHTGLMSSNSDVVYTNEISSDILPERHDQPICDNALPGRHEHISAKNISYFLAPRKSCFSSRDQSLFSSGFHERIREREDFECSIRGNLYELTEDFLHAFDSYVTFDLRPLMVNPFQLMPRPTPFNPVEFLENLLAHGLFTLMHGVKMKRLYKEFIDTLTFREWFNKEYRLRERQALENHIELCSSVPHSVIKKWVNSELEDGYVFLSENFLEKKRSNEGGEEDNSPVSNANPYSRSPLILSIDQITKLQFLRTVLKNELDSRAC